MSTLFCRSCGRPIVWAETQHGKRVPLDPNVLVFSVVMERGKLIAVKPTGGVIGERFLASHFSTCPQADKWNDGKPWDAVPPLETRDFTEPKEVI